MEKHNVFTKFKKFLNEYNNHKSLESITSDITEEVRDTPAAEELKAETQEEADEHINPEPTALGNVNIEGENKKYIYKFGEYTRDDEGAIS
ncbi:MAG: hypothetical protein EOP56_11685 [Sphingobacteriales bacterium]|nr:MAG: hypothetical protein EOP56_11685 [Sphingobacteriales bacterium]